MAGKIIDQLTQLFSAPATGKFFSLLFVLVLASVGVGLLIFWNSQPDYQVLFSNLSPEDAGEMSNKLKEKKVPFRLSHNGATLLVPRDQVYDTRLSLVAEGLPKGGGVGFEVFDRTNFGTTDFVQKLNYQRALQGELSRTIKQIKEIEEVRVHIVTPKESLFVEEQRKPTASVFIRTRSGLNLGPPQVEGIVHLVASAVEGLDPGNITVVDPSGKILSRRSDSTLVGQLTTTQLEYQKNSEEGLKKKVQGMLEGVLGPNKAIARVSMDIDFQQVDITEERYEPNTVLRSEQKNVERSGVLSGAGVTKKEDQPDSKSPQKPGAESPIKTPANQIISPNANSSERQNEIRNYEVSKINKRVKNSVGQVKKISTAVIVDGTYKENTDEKGKKDKQYVPRSQEEMKSLESIVKKAVGYSEERKDQIEVINMPFYGVVPEEDIKGVKGAPWWQDYFLMGYKQVVSLVLALLFIFFVLRPLMKKRVFISQREPGVLEHASSPALALGGPQELSKEAKSEAMLSLKTQSVKLAKEDPSRTAGVVKSWLHEKEWV
jgi:flagellar M-ring protein FliF